MEQGEGRPILRPLKSLAGPFAASGVEALPGHPRKGDRTWITERLWP